MEVLSLLPLIQITSRVKKYTSHMKPRDRYVCAVNYLKSWDCLVTVLRIKFAGTGGSVIVQSGAFDFFVGVLHLLVGRSKLCSNGIYVA